MTKALRDLISLFQSWLLLPDPSPVLVVLAAIAANLGIGRPVWLQLLGPPSSGKTEILQTVRRIPKVFTASDLTVGGLLSGSKRSERSAESKGGLLGDIGDFGIIICKDFGSVLNMRAEARQALLMALREIYDGHWIRYLGNDGGTKFEWHGKIGFIGASTPTIDRHHALMNVMGERFTFFRMPPINGEEQAQRALDNANETEDKESQITDAVTEFFASLSLEQLPPERSDAESQLLIELATFAATCRTATERDNYSRQIEIAPEPERPARLVKVLDRLRAGLLAIGMDRDEIWLVIQKVAFDSLPEARCRIIRVLQNAGEKRPNLYELATASGCSPSTTRRHLEDLDHYGAISRQTAGPSRGDEYLLSEWAQGKLKAISAIPEKPHGAHVAPEHVTWASSSGDQSDISETPERGITQALGKSRA